MLSKVFHRVSFVFPMCSFVFHVFSFVFLGNIVSHEEVEDTQLNIAEDAAISPAAALAVTEPGLETSLKWATIKGAAGAFQMLVHAQNDIVSGHLLSSGAWEGVTRAVLCLFPCGDVMCYFG